MIKNKILRGVFCSLLFLLPSLVLHASASVAPPLPPESNPHIPVTEVDKNRVKFAEITVDQFLKQKTAEKQISRELAVSNGSFKNKDITCVNNPLCAQGDAEFMKELSQIIDQYGEITEYRHAHVIPWSIEKFKTNREKNSVQKNETKKIMANMPVSQPGPSLKNDEYIVHIYAKFYKSGWHHLDVILSEDESGKIYLRHFFTLPIPVRGTSFPPGVVCSADNKQSLLRSNFM